MSVKYTLFQNVVGPTHSAVSNDPCSRHCVRPLFLQRYENYSNSANFQGNRTWGVTGGWRVLFWFGQENGRDSRVGVVYGVCTGEREGQ